MPDAYTRDSSLHELSRTRTGRLLRILVARQAMTQGSTDAEREIFAGSVGYLTLEKIVLMSGGKLPWGFADSVLDLANGHPGRVPRRAAGALRARARSAVRRS